MKNPTNLPDDVPELKVLWRGDTFPGLELTFKKDGDPVDITGWTFLFQIRRRFDRDSELILEATETDGITITDAAGGKAKIDQFTVPTSGLYYYQLQVTSDTGFVDSPMYGSINFPNDLSHE